MAEQFRISDDMLDVLFSLNLVRTKTWCWESQRQILQEKTNIQKK